MKMNRLMTGAFALTAAAGAAIPAFADGETPPPSVGGVTMTQAFDRKVTIEYTLADGPAVITLDVQTNATPNAAADDPGWTSIGGEAIWNAAGDVWKKVAGDTTHTITWRPDQSWPGHKVTGNGARAVVTAWATNNTPDYMVVDLEVANSVRFYPAVDFLPKASFKQGGAAITNNPAYKKTAIVMRKIEAAGIEWTMGSADGETQRKAARETPHKVTLANNYYIGVFEITQAQWKNIAADSSAASTFTTDGDMRPMEMVSYNEIRNAANTTTANTAYNWPNDPNPSSFLGRLRSKTGLDFDLPSEAQWEFAARSGHGSGYWNDGTSIMNESPDLNLNNLARYLGDNPGGDSATAALAPAAGGTGIVGSYVPSDWGLYDMHGNVWEWCLDWYQDNIATATDASGVPYGGRVNINPTTPAKTLSGTSSNNRVLRGGCWCNAATDCRPAYRNFNTPATRKVNYGLRVLCSVGL